MQGIDIGTFALAVIHLVAQLALFIAAEKTFEPFCKPLPPEATSGKML